MVQVPALYCTLDTPDTVPLMLVVAGSTEYVSRLALTSALGCVKHKPGCFPAVVQELAGSMQDTAPKLHVHDA